MVRHRVRKRFPWSTSALEQLAQLGGQKRCQPRRCLEGPSYRQLARQLTQPGLLKEKPDAATVRRALLRVRAVR
jgi:hypothetical protein